MLFSVRKHRGAMLERSQGIYPLESDLHKSSASRQRRMDSPKNRSRQRIEERVSEYLGSIARHKDIVPVRIGGVDDHVHLVVSIPPAVSISKALQLVKGGPSLWFHETFRPSAFAWQHGHGAFTVSRSQLPDVIRYVESEREHHRLETFQEEYLALLDKHDIDYDERYLWNESVRRYRDAVGLRFRGPGDKSPGYLQSIAPRCSALEASTTMLAVAGFGCAAGVSLAANVQQELCSRCGWSERVGLLSPGAR
jgi:putative transposase